jgi:hypothetical protein
LGRGLNQRELLKLEGSLEVQTLHEVIQSSRIWIGSAIQNAQSHQRCISLKVLLRIVWILRLLQRLREIYMLR